MYHICDKPKRGRKMVLMRRSWIHVGKSRKLVCKIDSRCSLSRWSRSLTSKSTPSSSSGDDQSDDRIVSRLGPNEALKSLEQEFTVGLKLVDARIEQAILELEGLRQDVPKWKRAFEAVQDIALSPKKHLFRPKLVFLGYASGRGEEDLKGFANPSNGLIEFAAGVELQHLFMFVHDDMMDHALTRRGRDTIQVAISRSEREESGGPTNRAPISRETVQHLTTLVGDVLQAKSLALLARGEWMCNDHKRQVQHSAVDVIMEGAYRAGAAQFDDILGWTGVERALKGKEEDAKKEIILRLLADKASFHSFAAPLLAGLRLGTYSELSKNAMLNLALEQSCKDWAMHTGAAFQGLDDVMDLVLEVTESGKDRLQDIQEGRLSLPLFILRQQASEDEWARVFDILGSQTVMPPSERHFLLKMAQNYKLTSRTLDFVDQEIESARAVLQKSPLASQPVLHRGLTVFVDSLFEMSKGLRQNTYL